MKKSLMGCVVGCLVLLGGCTSEGDDGAGDTCSAANEGKAKCADGNTELICEGGAYTEVPCRGPGGCTSNADIVRCDSSAAQVGDRCPAARAGNGVCSTAVPNSILTCTSGAWAVSSSCPAGCTSNGTTVSCAVDNTCTAGTNCEVSTDVCVAGTCAAGLGRSYRVTVQSATAPVQNSAGEAWDIGGGAPDLFFVVFVNGEVVGQSTAVQDTFTATFNSYVDVLVQQGTEVAIQLMDEDVSSNDFIGGVTFVDGPTFITDARSGGLNGSVGNVTWNITITNP